MISDSSSEGFSYLAIAQAPFTKSLSAELSQLVRSYFTSSN
jgi:hypothetical protein